MKIRHLLFVVSMLVVPSGDSIAKSDAGADDAGAGKMTIPPRVEEKDLPLFDAEPFPSEKSKSPTMNEWTAAPRVRLTRMSAGVGCTAKRLREWVKIRCEQPTAGLRLIAGSTEGIALWVAEQTTEFLSSAGRFAEVVFPVRSGDARLFEVLSLEFGAWEGWGTESVFVIEEEWPEGGTPQIAMLKR